MQRVPPIGSRVRFHGIHGVGPCTGRVIAHYPKQDGTKRLPESRWHIGLLVDEVPVPWPYGGARKFAPCVSELTPLPALPTCRRPIARDTDVAATFRSVRKHMGPQRPGPRFVLEVEEVRAA